MLSQVTFILRVYIFLPSFPVIPGSFVTIQELQLDYENPTFKINVRKRFISPAGSYHDWVIQINDTKDYE